MKISLPFLVRLLAFAWLFLGLTTLDASAQRSRNTRKAKTEQQGRKDRQRTISGKKSTRKTAKADKKRQQVEVANMEGRTGKTARKRGKGEKKEENAGKNKTDRSPQASTGSPRKVVIDDKTVGKDDKGRPVYESPKGGRYYVNASGEKVYFSADKN